MKKIKPKGVVSTDKLKNKIVGKSRQFIDERQETARIRSEAKKNTKDKKVN